MHACGYMYFRFDHRHLEFLSDIGVSRVTIDKARPPWVPPTKNLTYSVILFSHIDTVIKREKLLPMRDWVNHKSQAWTSRRKRETWKVCSKYMYRKTQNKTSNISTFQGFRGCYYSNFKNHKTIKNKKPGFFFILVFLYPWHFCECYIFEHFLLTYSVTVTWK